MSLQGSPAVGYSGQEGYGTYGGGGGQLHPGDASYEFETLNKRDYYATLRERKSTASHLSTGAAPPAPPPLTPSKLSGKLTQCTVTLLDGTEERFEIDKNANGDLLFDEVCRQLDLLEREYFGITFRDKNIRTWLAHDKRISKQVKTTPWVFEFQVKFYPPDPQSLKEEMTRYYLTLQVRQDIVCGKIPCSFVTYALLGAYVVQSEIGDFDPADHYGVSYIQDIPFAPEHLQSPDLLQRVVDLHRLHKGQSPEEADLYFLENAKKLAFYGMDMHKVKNKDGETQMVGIYYDGIVVFRDRLRINRFHWPRILKILYKGKNFILLLRPQDGTGTKEQELIYSCDSEKHARAVYKSAAEHHSFFRTREAERPRKPTLLPNFTTTRKFRSTRPTMFEASQRASQQERKQPQVRRGPSMRKPVQYDDALMTLPPQRYAEPNSGYSPQGITPVGVGGQMHAPVNGALPDSYDRYPSRPAFAPESIRLCPGDRTENLWIDPKGVVCSAPENLGWQGVRTNKGVKGPGGQYFYEGEVLDSQEDGLVRLGWATNDAGLQLGYDNEGYGYGSDQKGYDPSGQAYAIHNAEPALYGHPLKAGDVIGCYVDLDKGTLQWALNGEEMGPAPFDVMEQQRGDAFFPTVSSKNATVKVNFGEEPFRFPPRGAWMPVNRATRENLVPNRSPGWRMNPYDITEGVEVAPDGMAVQSALGRGWQGCRANKGVKNGGKYYYEARPLESGLARIGWSTEEGSLDLGTDNQGFGYGADHEGFSLAGDRGKKMFNNEIENYGVPYGVNDVIGCYLDLDTGTVQWAKNGEPLGEAYQVPEETLRSSFFPTSSIKDSTLDFNFGDRPFAYPPPPEYCGVATAPNENTKLSRRKGPERRNKGLSIVDADQLTNTINNLRKTGKHPTTDRSEKLIMQHPDQISMPAPRARTDLSKLNTTVTNSEISSIEKGEPEVVTEQYYDEEGNLITRTVRRTRVKKTTTMTQHVTEGTADNFPGFEEDDDSDKALAEAILKVTGVDPNAVVVGDSVSGVQIRSQKSESEV